MNSIRLFLISYLLFTGTQSVASEITWSGQEIRLVEGDSSLNLTLNSADSKGISFNSFDSFSVDGQGINIINVDDHAPSLIVIQARDINISGVIELIGPKTDILFVSNSVSGNFTCSTCYLDNFSRVTIAPTPFEYGNDSGEIGVLSSKAGGSVYIENLAAPGTYYVEVLANTFSNKGYFDLNSKVTKTENGYISDLNGDETLGAGLLNAIVGDVEWDYDNQIVKDVDPSSERFSLNGSIDAVGIKLVTSGAWDLKARLNTVVDVLSAFAYQSTSSGSDEEGILGLEKYLGKETISIHAFSKNTASYLSSSINTQGQIQTGIYSDLILNGTSRIEAGDIEIASVGTLKNNRPMFARNINLSGQHIVNEAHLEGSITAQLYAEYNLVNQFGGEIEGQTVILESAKGIVRNGSRYPYRDDITNDYPLGFDEYRDLRLTLAETSKIGTYYHPQIDVSLYGNKEKPATHKAHISAYDLSISGYAVENINPYWASASSNGQFTLDKNLSTQVSIYAQNKLNILAKNENPDGIGNSVKKQYGYLLNSSALLLSGSSSQSLSLISTEILINQRYRNLNLLKRDYDSVTRYNVKPDRIDSSHIKNREGNPTLRSTDVTETVDTETFRTKPFAYSPPGGLLFFNELHMNTSVGFLNETSIFESYGLTKFYEGFIADYGIEHGGVSSTSKSYTGQYCFLIAVSGISEKYFHRSCRTMSDTGNSVEIDEPRGAPSLFLINGDMPVNSTRFETNTLDTYEFFEKQHFVKEVAYANSPDWWVSGSTTPVTSNICHVQQNGNICYEPGSLTTWKNGSWDHGIEGDLLVIDYDTATMRSYDHSEPFTTHRSETKEFSYVEELRKFASKVYEEIKEFLSEFKWWD